MCKLTEEEQKVLDTLADAWNRFLGLSSSDEACGDLEEFRRAIHIAQYIVYSRPVRMGIEEVGT